MTKSLNLDGNKIIHHLDHLTAWKRGELIYPIYLSFGPTKFCNHKCQFCAYERQEKEKVHFPLTRFKSLIDELKLLGLKSIFFSGDGEPLMHPDCLEMIKYADKSGIDVAMNTNGVLVSEEIAAELVESLKWIRISINGGTPESYSEIHQCSPSDFGRAMDAMNFLVAAKKKAKSEITIGVQTLLMEKNIQTIPEFADVLKDTGISYFSVKPYLYHPDTPQKLKWSPASGDLSRLFELEKRYEGSFKFVMRATHHTKNEKRKYSKCYSFPFMAELDATGNLYSCGPQIGKSDFWFGNVHEKAFKEIWDDKEVVIGKIYKNHDVNQCMSCCRNDSLNSALWDLQTPPEHVNFI